MGRTLLVLCIALAVAASGIAYSANAQSVSASASCAGAISWQSARNAVGRVATIRGNVAGSNYAASSNGSPTFIDLGLRYPNPRRMTIVVWRENRARFGRPESRYLGRTICVHGLVESYRGVAQIEATSPSQIAIAR